MDANQTHQSADVEPHQDPNHSTVHAKICFIVRHSHDRCHAAYVSEKPVCICITGVGIIKIYAV
jgi:hypothetical protein